MILLLTSINLERIPPQAVEAPVAPAKPPDAGPKWPRQGRGWAVESGWGVGAPAQGLNIEQGVLGRQGPSCPPPRGSASAARPQTTEAAIVSV